LYVHAGADHHCHRRIHARVCARPPVRVRKPGLSLAGNPHSCARHATQLGSFRVQRRVRMFGGIRNAYRHTLAALRAPHRKRRMRARADARARGRKSESCDGRTGSRSGAANRQPQSGRRRGAHAGMTRG
jgi:hypothetical protein